MNKLATATIPALLLGAFLLNGCESLEAAANEEKKNDTPTAVKPGAAFSHDDFEVAKGWKVVKEKFVNTANIKGLEARNTGGDQRHAQLTFRFYKGKKVLGEVECSSNEMQKGETSALDCFSLDQKFPTGYETIKVSDMW